MALERDDLEWVAGLAALSLTDEEIEGYRRDIGALLQAFEKLQALDVDGVSPAAHLGPTRAPLRKDDVRPSLSPEQALANAPAREGPTFLVPRIIE